MQTTILLVEDDAVLRRGLAELFTREDYRVIEAASVREAKEKLNSEVQAVVLDVGLPDGDGVTLAAHGGRPESSGRSCSSRQRTRNWTWYARWTPAETTM